MRPSLSSTVSSLSSTKMKVYSGMWNSSPRRKCAPEWLQLMKRRPGKLMLGPCGPDLQPKITSSSSQCKESSYSISIWMTTMTWEPAVMARKPALCAGNLCSLPRKYLPEPLRRILDFINSCLSSLEAEVCISGCAMNRHGKCLIPYVSLSWTIYKLLLVITKARLCWPTIRYQICIKSSIKPIPKIRTSSKRKYWVWWILTLTAV